MTAGSRHTSRVSRQLRRAFALAALTVLAAAVHAPADEWLVYIGGGIEAIDGGWSERRGQILFNLSGGTLVSVPFEDVDLPASSFITWQVGGRRRVPPRSTLPDQPTDAEAGPAPDCVEVRVLELRGGETLEIVTPEAGETIHIACLDAPETEHSVAALGWFGRATLGEMQTRVRPGDEVCLTEQAPPRRDGLGHRVVHVTLADGRDLATEVIAGGLGLLHPGPCDRAAHYRELEDRAIAGKRGLWGPHGARPAIAAVTHAAAGVGGGAPPPRRAGGG